MQVELRPVGASLPVGRICGECCLCCKVLGVAELHKPRDQWCGFAQKPHGCAIYKDRPESCRNFICLWLAGVGGEDARPDRIHGVLGPDESSENLVLYEDPGWPGHASAALKDFFDRFVADGQRHVFVFSRGRRELIARADRFEALRGSFHLQEQNGEAARDWMLD